jgi:F0F1-type ATP synthase membrane subunit b/b'
MSFDVHFWESLCFAIFVVIVYKPLKKILTEQLDAHSNTIRQLVTDAENLRRDAEKICKHYHEKHQDFPGQLALMTKHTKDNIRLIRQAAEKTLEEKASARRNMHAEKLALYDKEERQKVRETIVQKAMTLANCYMQDVTTPSVTQQEITDLLSSMRDKSITFH